MAMDYHAGSVCRTLGFEYGGDRPKSLKQVVIAPMAKARQHVWVLRVFEYDHYERMYRVTFGEVR